MATRLEMFVRRTIVIVAVGLAVAVALLVHGRISANEEARHASFFENAGAIRGAFQRALGPHPPVVELVIEPDACAARVVVGQSATQEFVLARASGHVTKGAEGAGPERDDVAFSMSAVPFGDVPHLVADGQRLLDAPAVRLVIDRLPAAPELRFRVFAANGSAVAVRSRDP